MPRRHTLRDCTTLPLPLTAPTPAPALLSAGTLFTAIAQGTLRPATDDEILDNRHRVIEFAPLIRCTVDGASAYPREVVKEALARNAAAVILAHNHPSGVAGDAIVSLAERGLL